MIPAEDSKSEILIIYKSSKDEPMAKMRVVTLASALRDLRQRVKIVPFETDASEERISLQSQRTIDGDKWGVSPVETWSKPLLRKINVSEAWKKPIYFLDTLPHGPAVSLRYFVDGIQRTTPIGKVRLRRGSYETVPIHFAQIAVALLGRRDRKLTMENEEMKLLLEYPNDFVKRTTDVPESKVDILATITNRVGSGIEGVDTSYRIARFKDAEKESAPDIKLLNIDGIDYPRLGNDILWQWCSDPSQFRSQARRWTTRYRDVAEQKVYDKALEKFGKQVKIGQNYELIVKDGPLTHVRGPAISAAIGVIKTFRTLFLQRSEMVMVFNLPYGYRSPVFTLARPDGNPEEDEIYDLESSPVARRNKLVSWYLRIRPMGRHDPTWGLLRLEMHVSALPSGGHAAKWTAQDTSVIDAISSKLCLEANPSSHPDSRWNNLIYPVKCCESFLRSRILPHVTARYLLGGN